MSKLVRVLIAILLVLGLTGPSFAEAPPDMEALKAQVERYRAAFEEKGSRTNVFNANRVIQFASSDDPQLHQAALGMFMGMKPEWDKELGWEDSPTQKKLKELEDEHASVSGLPMPEDNDTYAKVTHAWSKYLGDIAYHLRTYCATDGDDTCPKAEEMRKEAFTKLGELYNHGLASSAITFDLLQDDVLDSQWDELRKGLVDVDKAVPQLAEEKLAYWRGELKGGMEQYVKDNGSAMCQTVSGPGGAKLDLSKLKQLYAKDDKVLVRCVFAGPPSTFKRDGKDYWRVRLRWAGRWEELALIYEVARPSTKAVVEFTVPMSAIIAKINAKAKEGDFSYPGHWLRAEIGYVTPYIDRWEWQDGKKVPIYKHGQVAGTSFFARWK